MPIDASLPSSSLGRNTLVILLGTAEASSDRLSTDLRETLGAFSLSAGRLQEYFLHTYELDEKNLLSLLDGDRSTIYLEEEIAHFLRIRSKKLQQRGIFVQHIIIYCVGYYVVSSSDITLQLRYTQEPHQGTSELRFETLARLLHANTPALQPIHRILLLDGYLSETNTTGFASLPATMTAYVERAFAQTDNKARERNANTVLLCASQTSSSRPIKSNNTHDLSPFPFTNALLYTLTYGDGQLPQERFSLKTLYALIREFLLRQYPDIPIQPILTTLGRRLDKTNSLEDSIFPNMRRQQSTTLSKPRTTRKQKLPDNLFVEETRTANLSAANIAHLQELHLILLQRKLSPDSLFVSQQKLYLYESHLRQLSAIDMLTGTTNWSYKQRQYIDPEPIISDDLLYIRDDESTLLCLDTNTGRPRWSYSAQGSHTLQDTPLVMDGVIYATFVNDREDAQKRKTSIRAVDKETGRVLWEITTKQAIEYTLRANAGYLFTSTSDNRFHAMEAVAPWKNWTFAPSNASISFDPVVIRGFVYLVTDQYASGGGSALHALYLSTGRERWQYSAFTASQSIKYAPIVHDNFIYVVTHHKTDHSTQEQTLPDQIHAIDTNTGMARWSYPLTEPIAYGPLIMHNRLSIITRNNAQKEFQLAIFEATRDRLLSTISFITKKTFFSPIQKGSISYAPVIDNDMLYIICTIHSEQGNDEKRHTIYAVHVPSGSIRWETPLNGQLVNKPTIAHDLMYVLVREKANGRRLIVLSTTTGKQCWEYAKVDVLDYPPVITGNLLCLVTANPSVGGSHTARSCIRIFRLP